MADQEGGYGEGYTGGGKGGWLGQRGFTPKLSTYRKKLDDQRGKLARQSRARKKAKLARASRKANR